MKRKIILFTNVIMIFVLLFLNYFYQKNGFDFTLKIVCSSIFAVLGLVNMGYALSCKAENKKFYISMAVGLILAMLGDIFINLNFVVGAATFALGHVFFLVAYLFLMPFKWLDAVVSAVLFIGSGAFLLFSPLLTFDDPFMRWVCLAYALVISMMLGKAISNLIRRRDTLNTVFAFGSSLFFFSDLMLLLDLFVGRWNWTDNACMATYYPALCLLAFGMFCATERKKDCDTL